MPGCGDILGFISGELQPEGFREELVMSLQCPESRSDAGYREPAPALRDIFSIQASVSQISP